MNFSFHPEADVEFIDGVTYYENCDPGLGLDFSRQFMPPFTTLWTTLPCGQQSKMRSVGVLFAAFHTECFTASSLMAYSSLPSCTCTEIQTIGNTDWEQAKQASKGCRSTF